MYNDRSVIQERQRSAFTEYGTRPTYLAVPSLVHQIQVNVLPRKLLTQRVRLTASIASHIRSLLHIRQSNKLHIRVRLEHRAKALQRGIDRAPQRRGSHQLDIGVVREVIAQLVALLVAEICEKRIGDDVVGSGEVVNTLVEYAISAIVDGVLSRMSSIRDSARLSA